MSSSSQWIAAVGFVVAWLIVAPVQAQATSYTVGVFPVSATDTSGPPVKAPVSYPLSAVTCKQPKVASGTPPVLLTSTAQTRFDDPADGTKECMITIAAQMAALSAGTQYKLALQSVAAAGASAWSALSNVVLTQGHPCDGTPPTTGTTSTGARTLSWCWNGVDTGGNPTTVTTWTATIDGARAVLANVQVGATANAAGKKLYSAIVTIAIAGTHTVAVAGTNTVGESAFSQVFTVTATAPATVPSASEIRGIQ